MKGKKNQKHGIGSLGEMLIKAGVKKEKPENNNQAQVTKKPRHQNKAREDISFEKEMEGVTKIKSDNRADLNKPRKKKPTQKQRSASSVPKTKQKKEKPQQKSEQQVTVTRTVRKEEPIKPVRRRQAASSAKPQNIQKEKQEVKISSETRINSSITESDHYHDFQDKELLSKPPKKSGNQDEIELVIGLDFGTTYCKAVVQEIGSRKSWAVPFSEDKNNPYLLSTKVYLNNDQYNLHRDGRPLGNLKLPILQHKPSEGHALSVIAFLGLVIKYIRRWVDRNLSDSFGNSEITWLINIGLPAKDFTDSKMVGIYKKLTCAGLAMSYHAGMSLSADDIKATYARVFRAFLEGADEIPTDNGESVYFSSIEVFPEIAAQIYGYLKSDHWDRALTTFLMVDIGGGTIDAAIFHVEDATLDEPNFKFLGSAVEPLGVFILHANRLQWVLDHLEDDDVNNSLKSTLAELVKKGTHPEVIPNEIVEYLENAEFPHKTSDDDFYNKFRNMLWDEVVKKVRAGWAHMPVWEHFPYMLCGGGRTVSLYADFERLINRVTSSSSMRLNPIPMRKPENLNGQGIGEEVYQRLSVAYGLSFENLGQVINAENLAPLPPSGANYVANTFVSKDQV